MAEFRWGIEGEARNLIYLTCGTGCGVGLVLDGQLHGAQGVLGRVLGVAAMRAHEDREARFAHYAHPGDILNGVELAVLVNGGSASASEIVAGALKDNGRARVVGETTYGKGSVQTVIPLTSGRAIKLTTARYSTPSGRSIDGIGIVPDFVVHAHNPKVQFGRA
ncbi:MAG: ROK family protein, partial [Proteobacteria bacterium]|nr:ROK family protein [Pseudomonadota bacterium]